MYHMNSKVNFRKTEKMEILDLFIILHKDLITMHLHKKLESYHLQANTKLGIHSVKKV